MKRLLFTAILSIISCNIYAQTYMFMIKIVAEQDSFTEDTHVEVRDYVLPIFIDYSLSKIRYNGSKLSIYKVEQWGDGRQFKCKYNNGDYINIFIDEHNLASIICYYDRCKGKYSYLIGEVMSTEKL